MTQVKISGRIASIDIFRALIMLLMIFVNTQGMLHGVPSWLGHAGWNEDFLGLADIVFPCFLLIVGMSIPFAVSSREKKGDSRSKIIVHVAIRTFALLVMGMFLVNYEAFDPVLSGMSHSFYLLASTVAFVLIWNSYPDDKPKLKYLFLALKTVGVLLLAFLAIRFRGSWQGDVFYFGPRWWGILGLIGWTYLVTATIYVLSNRKITLLISLYAGIMIFMVVLFGFKIQLPPFLFILLAPLANGGFVALALAGIVASLLFVWARQNTKIKQYIITLIVVAVVMLIFTFLTRPLGGISKLRGTPSWIFVSVAISYALFALLFWLVDIKGKKSWFKVIEPAGTSTLLCYLIPNVYDVLVNFIGLELPLLFNTGWIGLLKNLLVAVMLIVATGLLGGVGIKMKL